LVTLFLQSLKATLLVIITFLALWLGMFVIGVISSMFAARKPKQDVVHRLAKGLKPATGNADQPDLESALHCYISSFFPHVYSDKPQVVRFWHGLTVSFYYF